MHDDRLTGAQDEVSRTALFPKNVVQRAFTMKSCADCIHARVKGGVLVYCEEGHWTKNDGSYKSIRLSFLPKSRLAATAEYCSDYEEDTEDDSGEDLSIRSSALPGNVA